MSELYGFKKNLQRVQVRSKAESVAKSNVVPTLIDGTPLAAPATKLEYASRTISELANWNVVALWCKCGNANRNIICFRGVNTQNYLIDALTSTVTRGGYYVDWANNRIRVRWVDGNASLAQSFVQILAVYGLVQNVDVVDGEDVDDPSEDEEDIDITALTEEVQGIRIGADGTVYDTAGDAVRSQYSELAGILDEINAEDVIEQINNAITAIPSDVEEWLNDHPEATTTVQDGSIAEIKINASFLKTIKNYYVTPEMYGAVGDGTTDDLSAFNSAIANMTDGDVLYLSKKYLLSDTLTIDRSINIIGNGELYVTHANPVLVVDNVDNAVINIDKIKKSAKVFDYNEGTITYSIGVVLKNCEGCYVDIHNIISVTTAFVLIGDGAGCHYNQLRCDNAQTFAGIEIIRTSAGGWVNGNRVNSFRWMVNTWSGNTYNVAGYMIKSLSYTASGETEPYKNNGNYFEHLIAEYGASSANYPILLARLDYARGYHLQFDRVEISAANSSLNTNSLHFTNSISCIAYIDYSLYSYTYSVGTMATDHNAVYVKSDLESLIYNGISSILSDVTIHQNLSYTSNWFQIVKNPATRTVRIMGELITNADISTTTHLFENLPTCRQGWGIMKLIPSITETQWSAAGTVTHYKLSITSGKTFLVNVGAIPSGTHLFVDFEYLADDSAF